MPTLQQQFGTTIDDLKRLGDAPTLGDIELLCHHLEYLDGLLRVGDQSCQGELCALSRQAHALVRAARSRAMKARRVARAIHDREVHDTVHFNGAGQHFHTLTGAHLGGDRDLDW